MIIKETNMIHLTLKWKGGREGVVRVIKKDSKLFAC